MIKTKFCDVILPGLMRRAFLFSYMIYQIPMLQVRDLGVTEYNQYYTILLLYFNQDQ